MHSRNTNVTSVLKELPTIDYDSHPCYGGTIRQVSLDDRLRAWHIWIRAFLKACREFYSSKRIRRQHVHYSPGASRPFCIERDGVAGYTASTVQIDELKQLLYEHFEEEFESLNFTKTKNHKYTVGREENKKLFDYLEALLVDTGVLMEARAYLRQPDANFHLLKVLSQGPDPSFRRWRTKNKGHFRTSLVAIS